MPKVSVVVPIYNVEQYLCQALDSLMNQTLEDIEIICVNDGSTDGSPDIIRSYAEKDSRFKMVDKPNGGYGQSMNMGIEAASGEYVGILEPDDFYELNTFENLYNIAVNMTDGPCYSGSADIVRSAFYYFTDADENYASRRYVTSVADELPGCPAQLKEEDAEIFLRDHPAIWSAIYAKSFLDEHKIRFNEVPGAGWVDNPFVFETICAAKKVAWDPRPYYNYRVSNEGASSFLKDYNIPLDRLVEIKGVLDSRGITSGRKMDLYIRRVFNYVLSIINGMSLEGPQPELYERIINLFSMLEEEQVLNCDLLTEERKLFYREIMGMRAAEVTVHDCCSDPDISFVVPAQDVCKHIYEMLLSISSIDGNFEVLCVKEGPSSDCTDVFIDEVRAIDKRIKIVDCKTASWIDEVKGKFVVFTGDKRRLTRKDLDFVECVEGYDAVVFAYKGDVLQEHALTEAEIVDRGVTNQSGTCSNVAVSREYLQSIGDVSNDLLIHEGRGLYLRILLGSKAIHFERKGISRLVKRSDASPSIKNARSKPLDKPNSKTAAIPRLYAILESSNARPDTRALMTNLFVRYMVQELNEIKDYRVASEFAQELKERFVPSFVGDVASLLPVGQRSNGEELYYVVTDTAHAFFAKCDMRIEKQRKDFVAKSEKLEQRIGKLENELAVANKKLKEANSRSFTRRVRRKLGKLAK